MQLFEFKGRQVEALLAQLEAGQSVVLGSSRPDALLLNTLADRLGEAGVLVQVTRQLDMAAYIPLVLAHQCNHAAVDRVSTSLTDAGPVGRWREALDEAMQGRFLLASGTEALAPSATGWDLRGLFASETQMARDWLVAHATVTTRARAPVARLQPAPDDRWDGEALWQQVDGDPDRYALAVARQLLQGPSDPALRGWDDLTLLQDLWQAMPSGFRDLVALLAAHGRPIVRPLFERLALVGPELIDQARDLALVEQHRGQLALARPWQEGMAHLEPGPDRGRRHRQLAEAFAGLSEPGSGALVPMAVLEAHRHFAAIPDLGRATAFARYGTGALLETAVAQSFAGRNLDSARTYDALLDLDDRLRQRPNAPGIGRRARAYAIHYRHYNRYRAHQETVNDTAAGYREALHDWPDNALFWSRLVRALFVAQDETAAMTALDEALRVVPEHPERVRMLVVRTTDRLLQRGLVLPAVFVWWKHPQEEGVDASVGVRLMKLLERGWSARRLWAPDVPSIDADPPILLQVTVSASAPGFDVHAGEVTRQGATIADGVRAAVRAVVVERLAARWRRETGGLAVASARYAHPAYQAILGMGREVVPDLLRVIERQPDHWHQALSSLTGASPVVPGTRVTVSALCAAWVAWGRTQGLAW